MGTDPRPPRVRVRAPRHVRPALLGTAAAAASRLRRRPALCLQPPVLPADRHAQGAAGDLSAAIAIATWLPRQQWSCRSLTIAPVLQAFCEKDGEQFQHHRLLLSSSQQRVLYDEMIYDEMIPSGSVNDGDGTDATDATDLDAGAGAAAAAAPAADEADDSDESLLLKVISGLMAQPPGSTYRFWCVGRPPLVSPFSPCSCAATVGPSSTAVGPSSLNLPCLPAGWPRVYTSGRRPRAGGSSVS